MVKLLIPAVLFNVTVTGVSNWKGALGLSPVKLVHKGYFDHWQQEKENMALKGNEKIWEILEADPGNQGAGIRAAAGNADVPM